MEEDDCQTRLGLGLSIMTQTSHHHHDDRKKKSSRKKTTSCLDLSFKLFPRVDDDETAVNINDDDDSSGDGLVEFIKSDGLATKSSTSPIDDGKVVVDSNNKEVVVGGRKKLRLSNEQSSLLENRFKLQTTLNTAQKQALAEQLKLTPRQVEVWFQNRRARTKLKQTEVDCEFLKKCCESLSNENRRLKTELQELRFERNDHHRMCQSCHKRNVLSGGTSSNSSGQPYHHHDHNKP